VLAKAFRPRLSEGSLRCMGEPTGMPSNQNLVTFNFTKQTEVSKTAIMVKGVVDKSDFSSAVFPNLIESKSEQAILIKNIQ
jgi:hypothetical protein